MDVEGLKLHPSQVIIRNLLRFIDILPLCYLVGGLSCLFSPKSQRLGDIAGNTVVIREPRIPRPDFEQIQAYKYNPLLDHPRLVARLRQRISLRQAHAALQALIRRDRLEPLSRIELFERIASYFRQRASFPEDVVEGITDEQFVRNVVSALFMSSNIPGSMRKEEYTPYNANGTKNNDEIKKLI